MSDGSVGMLVEGLQSVSVRMCPMLRLVPAGHMYPVRGYCVVGRSPGGFMIPSIAEFREFCSGPGFAACPWFGSAQDDLQARPEASEQ
jgi:hypothetical protein